MRYRTAPILQGDTGICETFETAVVQIPRTSNQAEEVAQTLVNDPTMLASIVNFVDDMTDQAVSRAVKSEASAVLPSPSSSGYINSSSECKKGRRKESRRSSRKKRHRRIIVSCVNRSRHVVYGSVL